MLGHDGGSDELSHALQGILDALRTSDVLELVVEDGDNRIRLHRRQPGAFQIPLEISSEEARGEVDRGPELVTVTSPLVGTFYRAGHPGMPPLVEEGSAVDENTVVGIVEALQVLTDVEAGCRGVIRRVLATDGQPVEYGQILFELTVGD